MFEELSIKNFRGIRQAEIKGFSQVNLLLGKNNCGKSSVLEALFLISGQVIVPLSLASHYVHDASRPTTEQYRFGHS